MIDLHTHTTISDGSYTPTELIRLAKETGLKAVAITDHDCVEGLDEAAEEAQRIGVKLIPGIEFDVRFLGRRLHVLGLNINKENETFQKIYKAYRTRKEGCLDRVFELLREMGVTVSFAEVLPFQTGGSMDRQAIAKYLVAKGYTNDMKESWGNYLDRISFLEEELLEPEAALLAIHSAGGRAFLAHCHLPIGLAGMTDSEAESFLKDLQKMGLDGMEYHYPSFTREDQERCGRFIEMFGFRKCGGTDFHGRNRPQIRIGIGEGNFVVPDEILEYVTG